MTRQKPKLFLIPFLSFLAFVLTVPLSVAAALETDTVRDGKGNPVFIFNYFNTNDYSVADNVAPEDLPAWYVADPAMRQSIHNAGKAWADILGSIQMPATLSVIGTTMPNATAGSNTMILPDGSSDYSSVGAALNLGYDGRDASSPSLIQSQHGIIDVGDWRSFGGTSFYSHDPISALPRNGDTLPAEVVYFHELGHALGILSNSASMPDPNAPYGIISAFQDDFNLFTQGLVNSQGERPRPGMGIARDRLEADYLLQMFPEDFKSYDDIFMVSPGRVGGLFFEGENLSEVLQGAYGNRATINAWESTAEFSHIEFKNSLMSHQLYRNTGVFFEAELAIMQDIGYTVDRRNFYGRSIYNSGQTIVNDQGFFARNDSGTAYLDGVHNRMNNAVGLHIFGDDNHVAQNADILAAGSGALGVRVDGVKNHLTINQGVRVESTGDLGIGVAVAYGRGHTLNHQGVVVATGAEGRGVSFDFGSNIMSDIMKYEGSYISTNKLDPNKDFAAGTTWNADPLNPLVDGALVERFDLSGAVVSDHQAIFISENAHVKEINILSGAFLKGDVVSNWNPNTVPHNKHSLQLPGAADYRDFVTNLTFGRAQDADGNVARGADANFRMRYSDDIKGPGGLALTVAGGVLEFNGRADVVSIHNQKGATLAGAGTLRIADPAANLSANFGFTGRAAYANDFVNDGVLAPGDADNQALGTMRIELARNADFINNGTIQIGFDQQGGHDVLSITGAGGNTNAAQLNGVTEAHALPGYYANGVRYVLDVDNFIQVAKGVTLTNNNTYAASSFSPTVDMNVDLSGGRVAVYASRNKNSYAQFGNDPATKTVGRELWRISYLDDMPGSFHEVLAGLDLAGSGEGVERGLNQLVPHFANAAAQQSLDNQRTMSNALLSRLFPNAAAPSHTATAEALGCIDSSGTDGRRVFATAIGGGGRQNGKGYNAPGFSFWSAGVLTGVEVERGGVTGGLHLAMNHWKQRGSGSKSTGSKNRVNAFSFGLHGSAAPSDWNGGYLFALARGAVERNHMDRAVNLVTGRSVNQSKWTGASGNAVLGGGFDFECGSFRFGPLAGLDYAVNHRGSVGENGRFGLLDIESGTYQSFRVLAGLRASGRVGERTSLSATARYNYEILDKTGTTRAKFSGVGLDSFSTRGRYAGRHSLTASLGLRHALGDRAYLEIEGGGEFFRGGHASGWGGASLAWEF